MMSMVQQLVLVAIVISTSATWQVRGEGSRRRQYLSNRWQAVTRSSCTARPAMGAAVEGTAPWHPNYARVLPT